MLTPPDATELFRTAPERYLDVGEGQVAYRRVGTGPDVLFVHGWPVSSATYRRLLPHLAPHVTCHLIDLVGAGDSRFEPGIPLDLGTHVRDVRRIVDALELSDFSVVAHDSGGMIARHALAGDDRLRAMVLVNTEQPQGLNWRFGSFLWLGLLPGVEHLLAWAANQGWLRRNPYLLGDCFVDRSLLDGEFEELFLAPLRDDRARRWAAGELLRTFDRRFVTELGEVHRRIAAPVTLVWGKDDPFFRCPGPKGWSTPFPRPRCTSSRAPSSSSTRNGPPTSPGS